MRFYVIAVLLFGVLLAFSNATPQEDRAARRQALREKLMKRLSMKKLQRVQQPMVNNQQPTANNQQPTANNQQPTANYQQPTANNQQPTQYLPSQYQAMVSSPLTDVPLSSAEAYWWEN